MDEWNDDQLMLVLLAAQHPSPRRCLLPFFPDALLPESAAPPSTRIRGAASAILNESSCLVRTSMQEHRSRDAKKAPRMPPPTTSAARHSGLPHPAAGPGAAWAPAAGGGSPRARRSRRKAKGTHRGEEEDEEEEARVAMTAIRDA